MSSSAYARIKLAEVTEANARAAKPETCKRCNGDVLRGDDHDKVARVVVVDLDPLNEVGEMLAHLDGRDTFNLYPMPRKPGVFELEYRESWHIAGQRGGGPILAEHHCAKGKML